MFVDPTGRRRRFARRATVLLVLPVAGYVALLASTLLGGPTVHSPFLPVPDAVRPPGKAQPRVNPVEQASTDSTVAATPRPTPPTTSPTLGEPGTGTPAAVPTSAPVGAPTSVPASTATATRGNQPSAPPGQTAKPTAHASPAPGRSNSPTAKPTKTPG